MKIIHMLTSMKIIRVFLILFMGQRTVSAQNHNIYTTNHENSENARNGVDAKDLDDDYDYDYDPEEGSNDIFNDSHVVKCCPEGEMVEKMGDIFKCTNLVEGDDNGDWLPDDFVHGHDTDGNKLNLTTQYQLKFLEEPLFGNSSLCLDEEELHFWEPHHILTNKMAPKGNSKDFFECVDSLVEGGNIKERPVVLACKDKVAKLDEDEDEDETMRIVHTVAGVCGIICLLLAVVVYLVLPSKRNIHGQLVTCNMLSTLGVTVFLILVYHSNHLEDSVECRIIGFVGYFLTMAMFTWMTVLCMDVFWTFVRPRVMSGPGTGKRLALFHSLGWGLPALLTVLAGVLDHLDVANSPGIGTEKCFVKNDSSVYYLHIPITLFVSVNVFLYVVTVCTIARIRSAAKGTNKSSQAVAQDQFVLFTKLFVVMGLLWICESVQYYIFKITGQQIRAVRTLFDIFAVLNMLRGVFIFIIFVCKKSVWNGLMKLRQKRNYNEQTTKYLSSRRLEKTSTSVACSTTYVSTTKV